MKVKSLKIVRSNERKNLNMEIHEKYDEKGRRINRLEYKIDKDSSFKNLVKSRFYKYYGDTDLIREETLEDKRNKDIDKVKFKYNYDKNNRVSDIYAETYSRGSYLNLDLYKHVTYHQSNGYHVSYPMSNRQDAVITDDNGNEVRRIITSSGYMSDTTYEYDDKNKLIESMKYTSSYDEDFYTTSICRYDENENCNKETKIISRRNYVEEKINVSSISSNVINKNPRSTSQTFEYNNIVNEYGDLIHREYFDDIYGFITEEIEYEYYEEEN